MLKSLRCRVPQDPFPLRDHLRRCVFMLQHQVQGFPRATTKQSANRPLSYTTQLRTKIILTQEKRIYSWLTFLLCPQNALGHSAWRREWRTWLSWRRLDFNLTKLKEMVILTSCSFNILIVHILQKHTTMWTHCWRLCLALTVGKSTSEKTDLIFPPLEPKGIVLEIHWSWSSGSRELTYWILSSFHTRDIYNKAPQSI